MPRKKKNKAIILAGILAALAVFLLSMIATILIVRHVKNRSDADTGRLSKINEGAENSSLTDVDLTGQDIAVSDEKSAQKALSKMQGVFSDKNIEDNAKLDHAQEIGGSVYYSFDCTYDCLPIFGRRIVLAAHDGKADTVVSNYRRTDLVSSDDNLDQAMLTAGVERFLDKWTAENFDEDPGYSPDAIGQISDEQKGYYPVEQDMLVLAYMVPCSFTAQDGSVFSPDLIVSAADGEVLDYSAPCDDLDGSGGKAAKAYNADGTEVVDAVVDDNWRYTLKDAKLNITILNAGGKSHKKSKFSDYKPVTSDNRYFGDTKAEQDDHYDRAVRLLKILQDMSVFYRDHFRDQLTAGLTGVYDDGYSGGKNMSSQIQNYPDKTGGIIYVGSNRDYGMLDTFGHEYGHLIEQEHVGLTSSENRTREIKEATADILGILYESVSKREKPDWKIDPGTEERNLAKGGNQQDLLHPNDYHKRSTEFSHAAYLMYSGSGKDDTEAIKDTEVLMELWYRTVLLLSGSPTYQDGRVACEAAARQMVNVGSLNEKQYRCVEWAFDSIGITSNRTTMIKTFFGGKLKVRALSALGGGAANYTIEIRNTAGKKVFSRSVKDTGLVEVELDPGSYTVTVKDNQHIWADAYGSVSVSAGIVGSVDGKLEIPTTFGTNLQGQAWESKDKDSGTVSGASIILKNRTVTDFDRADQLTAAVKTDEDGYYYLNVRPGTYILTARKDGYETVKIDPVHIHAGKNNRDSSGDPPKHFIVMKKTADADGQSGGDTGGDAASYADVIREAEAKHGQFSLENEGWCCMTHGVNYLQLIDLDEDGSEELLLGYYGSDESKAYYDMPLEVWTLENGSPRHAGDAQVHLLGADLSETVIMRRNGKPAIVGGNMLQEPMFKAWTFDGRSLTAEDLDFDELGMLDYIQADTGAIRFLLNADPTDRANIEKTFSQINSVKREVGLPEQQFPAWPFDTTD